MSVKNTPMEDPAEASPSPEWQDLTALVHKYSEELYRYAYRLSGSTADADDLTQQVFLIAQRKLSQVRSADCVRSWLYSVLRNCYLKAQSRPTPATETTLAFSLDSLPEDLEEDEIDREQLQAAINELPDDFKIVVLMFYFDNLSYRGIAAELNLPIGTVMSRLSRGKASLRHRLTAKTSVH
jgi:RNA polymerase sigma-70 factor (ECF subfamily)